MNEAIRALIYNRNGGTLAEIEPQWETVSWRLNNIGLARFSMPYTDAKCTRTNLRPGNRILIQFENGLPDWGGVLDFPRKRSTGGVTISAYTGEKLLDHRRTSKNLEFTAYTPGAIYKTLLETQSDVLPGTIVSGGTQRNAAYHYHDLLRRVQELARLSGYDFYVQPQVTAGVLRFYGNWYARRGSDLTSEVLLAEDVNMAVPQLDEQGPLANQIYCIGAGTTWGDERLVGSDQDADSIELYDLREYAEVQSAAQQATLDANAAELVARMAYPRDILKVTAFDRAPGLFSAYDVGDIVKVQAFLQTSEWSYDEEMRVIAREWLPDGTTRLEVQRWVE